MSLNLVKLCVGCDSVEDLGAWQAERLRLMKRDGLKPEIYHRTFQSPKRRDELLDGGSLYWVIKGVILARQRLLDIREGTKDNGTPCALLVLDKALVPVRPVPRRAFQGWRYLTSDDAPADLVGSRNSDITEMPPKLRRELADLGLI
ncbi:MAG: DUF1489 domain-containing protein [Hyphomicrobiaceae bacterium]